MKRLALIIGLLTISTHGQAAITNKYKVLSDGYGGVKLPHAVLYSTYTQAIAATNAVQHIEFKSFADFHGITQVTPSTFTVIEPGCYEFCFSGIADIASLPAGRIEFWLRHNGVDVTDSNTIASITTASVENIVSVCLILDMAGGDNFTAMTYGSDTDLQWLYTAATTNPTRPATPSVIMTIKKISGVWE